MSSNIRLNITHRPLGDLYVVYNDTRDTDNGELIGRALIIKLTNLFNFSTEAIGAGRCDWTTIVGGPQIQTSGVPVTTACHVQMFFHRDRSPVPTLRRAKPV